MKSILRRIINFLTIAIAITSFAVGNQQTVFGQAINSSDIVPPSNDSFENAYPITDYTGYLQGTNLNASVEASEPLYYKGGQTVWYRWVSPETFSVTFDLRSIESAPIGIAIYAGSTLEDLAMIGHGISFDRVTFIAAYHAEYWIQISSKSLAAGEFALMWSVNGAETWKQFNFDGPAFSPGTPPVGKSDFAIHRWWTLSQPTGQWWLWLGNSQTSRAYDFGFHFIVPANFAPGDYDGDGVVDIAFYHQTDGLFWIYRSSIDSPLAIEWGVPSDQPVQGDFDGDDLADIAIWRPSNGTFWVLKSTDGIPLAVQWGLQGDLPVVADYDGDGITDFAVKRGMGVLPAIFYILQSSDRQVIVTQFGYGSDMTAPGDYDGDGRVDLAVFRPANRTFYYLRSRSGDDRIVTLPTSFFDGDRVVPGDYFGDSRSDICLWKYRTGDFQCFSDAGEGDYLTFHFGLRGDEPVASSNVH